LNPAHAALQAFAQREPVSPPVAVAYSGGADSTALLRAAAVVWPGQVRALHVHHGLQAAAEDFERECRATCAALVLPLQVLRVQAAAQPGQSPEDAARGARYRALAQAAQEAGCGLVLLGQHADDQAETVLLALGRGAGLAGLAAMPERFERHGMGFARPLLALPGPVLRQSLVEAGHSFIDDPSNADERYSRNKLRARLLPALAEVMPHYRETLARSARHAAQAQALLDEVAAQDMQRTGNPPGLQALQALTPARQANVLRHWLAANHGARPSTAQLDELQRQIAACRTRGHRIALRVAQGRVQRQGSALAYLPGAG
jgi:tRNA(Ile)-lysidine synthase